MSLIKGEDSIAWNLSPDGEFSNASSYLSLLEHNVNDQNGIFKGVWRWSGPERFRMHLWKLSHEALVTNSWHHRRNLADSAYCPICEREDKSVLHVVRDCVVIKRVWNILAEGEMSFLSFFSENLQDWILLNLKSSESRRGLGWALIYGKPINQMVERILRQAKAIEQSMNEYVVLHSRGPVGDDLLIKWTAPEKGFFKLNCDGAVTNYGCGGVLRDEEGRFIFGFACGLGSCSITQVELWAILIDLQQTKDRGIGG